MSLVVKAEPRQAAGLDDAVRALRGGLRAPAARPVADRLAALGELSQLLLQREASLAVVSAAPGAAFLAGFLQQANLQKLIAREFDRPDALDRFVAIESRKTLRLVPRGLVCHWLAGNVPLLGVFSWALSAVVGNANLIRLSSRQHDLLSPLLAALAERSDAGREMAALTRVARFERDDVDSHRQMSQAADLRIAWGGREAVETVRALPARWDCEDLILGPRVSLAVVDPDEMSDRACSRLATDVIYFDQQACSSPQVLYVKAQPGAAAFDGFLARFQAAFAAQSEAIGRHPLDHSETYQIQLDRTRVLLSGGELRRDDQTAWTLALVARPLTGVYCTNRFLQVVPFGDLTSVVDQIPDHVQTVVVQLHQRDSSEFTERAARRGVCRFPAPGEGNHFETPWDGNPLLSRMARWVTRTESVPGA